MESDEEFALEEQLFILKTTAKKLDESIITIENQLKVVQQKLKIELEELSATELRSRPSLRTWLKSHDLPENCSFQDFFEAFLQEHQKDYRLNLSDRTIRLNKEASHLFGVNFDTTLSLLEILERLPLLYH